MINIKPRGWGELAYWQSGEWQTIRERLSDETQYNPPYRYLFACLRALHPSSCRVAIFGQDPYPNSELCTGFAFDIPRSVTKFPPSLVNIFKEYQTDLGYPCPDHGCLDKWCAQGVLLWNVYPSCRTGCPGSHHWVEWEELTKEITEKLDGQVVFVLLGASARSFAKYIQHSPYIETSHPSPMGVKRGFSGSRIFTRTNDALIKLGKETINWRL